MTLSALLLAAAVLTPSQQTATVPTDTHPPVSVGTPPVTECGRLDIDITAPRPVNISFRGDLGDQPPGRTPMQLHINRPPGTRITSVVVYWDDYTDAATIDVTVPPCLGDPLLIVRRPPAERRARVFEWAQRRFGGW